MKMLENISKKFHRGGSNVNNSQASSDYIPSESKSSSGSGDDGGDDDALEGAAAGNESKEEQQEGIIRDIELIEDSDILLGRGRTSWSHIGNKKFRTFVGGYLKPYMEATNRTEKTQIVHQIYEEIIHKEKGRFLKLDPATGKWATVQLKLAREKIAHALRDAIGLRIKLGEEIHQDETTQQLLAQKQTQRQLKKQASRLKKQEAEMVQSNAAAAASIFGASTGNSYTPFFAQHVNNPPLPPSVTSCSHIPTPQMHNHDQRKTFNNHNQQQTSAATQQFHTDHQNQSADPKSSLLSLVNNMLTELDGGGAAAEKQTHRHSLDGDFSSMSIDTSRRTVDTINTMGDSRRTSFADMTKRSMDDIDVSAGFGMDTTGRSLNTATSINNAGSNAKESNSSNTNSSNSAHMVDFVGSSSAGRPAPLLSHMALMPRIRPRRGAHQRQHSFDSMDSRLKAPLEENMSDFGSVRDLEDMSMASSIKTSHTKQSMDISIKSTDTEREWRKTLSALKDSM